MTTFKRDRCAPQRGTRKANTCYSDAALGQLKDEWNRGHAAAPIASVAPQEIWDELQVRHPECDRESCWTRSRELKQRTFAPTMPSSWKRNINEWLSSDEIIEVMKQYERVFPEFAFLGPSPTDYFFVKNNKRCVWEDLCKFNLASYVNRGKTKIGIVFNLDEHDQPGSHWVALFINAQKRAIYFFDSTGDRIHKHINRFRKTVQAQAWKTLRQRYSFTQNAPVEHQYGNTECGMYVLFFIITMLQHDREGVNGEALGPVLKKTLKGGQRDVFTAVFKNKNNKFPDKLMEGLRKKYFNEE
jgi:hypothetical protein